MLFNLVLVAVIGSAVAAPAPAISGPIIGVSGWTVRADWSRELPLFEPALYQSARVFLCIAH